MNVNGTYIGVCNMRTVLFNIVGLERLEPRLDLLDEFLWHDLQVRQLNLVLVDLRAGMVA